ncbi:MAG: AIR synthase-related protein, partial [Flavobacteriales bacterium]
VPVFPSPVIGMMGSLEERRKLMTLDMKEKGDLIYLLGETSDDINASHYLNYWHGIERSPAPFFDLEKEVELQHVLRDMIDQEAIRSAHDVSDGGLYVSLVEKAIPRGFGFDIESDGEVRKDAFLFGEGQGRVLLTVSPGADEGATRIAEEAGVPLTLLGHVTRGKLMVDGEHFGFIRDAEALYEKAIPRLMEEV